MALDFGGTKLAAGLADALTGEWLQTRRATTPAHANGSLAVIASMAEEMLSDAHLGAIGVSFGGHVDVRGASVRGSSIVSGWDNLPLGEWLTNRFGAPTRVINDGSAGALGEHSFGILAGTINAIYITVSTGVGGGFLLEGRPYLGTTGLAGEFGHLPVRNSQVRCKCGRVGCLEAIASGTAVAANARARLAGGAHSTLKGLPGVITAQDVSVHADSGDQLAQGLLWEAGAAIGEIASGLVTSFDPQRIAIGGGVAGAAEPFWTAIQDTFSGLARDGGTVTVVPAAHINDAPLYGALSIALQLAHGNIAPSLSLDTK
jgi:glucokinase